MATLALTDMTFSNYSGKVAILIKSSGTYTLDNCQFDQSGSFDIEIDSGVSGATILALTNGSTGLSLGDVDNNGSGTVTIQNNVTVTVIVKDADGNLSGARVLLEAASGGDLPAGDSVTTIAASGTTATVTHPTHGMLTGQEVIIRGANESDYNNDQTITVTDANTYTYTMGGSPTSPATGTITCTARIINETSDGSGITTEDMNFSGDQPIVGVVRKSSGAPYYKTGVVSGTITSGGFSTTIILIGDQ